ncbi:MAG: rhodanese-like domain-containing protein [Acidobacteriota bacterium]|nr:rhodanese-like domain-containing protein [Acidobacteriota bacterium]
MTKRVLGQAAFLIALALVAGTAARFSMLQKLVRGEFRGGLVTRSDDPGIRQITIEEAEHLFATAAAVFIDSRSEEEFLEGRIPGARNIPVVEIAAVELDWPPEQTLVIYCEGGTCLSSLTAARLLHIRGFRDLRVFLGGWEAWLAAGLPVEEGL